MSDPSGSSTPKAIGSLARKQSDVTRQGTQKLKFIPTLPQRRKKDDTKQEPTTQAVPPSPQKTERGGSSSRGTGRGDARGRGRGRGAPPVVEMTASGPFAMGPSQVSNTPRRSTPQSNFVPAVPTDGTPLRSNISKVSQTGLQPVDRKEKGLKVEDEEVYSDPDDGVEIVDMDQVHQMDWMAPEVLRRDRQSDRHKVKEEEVEDLSAIADHDNPVDVGENDEEELEDIMENFTARATIDTEGGSQEQLYLFQLPSPFPSFVSKSAMEVHQHPVTVEKKVTFASDVKSDGSTSPTPSAVPESSKTKAIEPVDGLIGRLEVYKSGAVKMRFANDILLDVNGGTQPSFLQHVVHLDKAEKRLVILGEVNKQFVVSPNIDALLSALDKEDAVPSAFQGEDIIGRRTGLL